MAWIFFLYLAVLLVIGFVTRRATRGMSGYLLDDRRVGPWTTALSYEATAYSGWLMLGFPGRAFSRGVAAIWVGVACVLGDALNWVAVGRRLRWHWLRSLAAVPWWWRSSVLTACRRIRIGSYRCVTYCPAPYSWPASLPATCAGGNSGTACCRRES